MKTVGDLKILIKKIWEAEDVGLENEIGQAYRRRLRRIHQAAMSDCGYSLEELLEMKNQTELGELTKEFAEQLKDWAEKRIFISARYWRQCAA